MNPHEVHEFNAVNKKFKVAIIIIYAWLIWEPHTVDLKSTKGSN